MRTPLLAMALGLSLAGCLTIGDSGSVSPGDDDDTGSGSGSNNGSNTGSNTGTPSVNVTMDRATVATELGKSEIVTLSFASVGSFTGTVTVAPSLLDGAGAALTAGGLTVTGPTSVAVAANGTASAMYTVTIPTDATATQMTAGLKLDVTSPVGNKTFTSSFTIAPVYSVTYAAGLTGNIAMHPMTGLKLSIKKGAKLVLRNADTVTHITHSFGNQHQPDPPAGTTNAGGMYTVDTAQLTGSGPIGCHTHQAATYATVTIVP